MTMDPTALHACPICDSRNIRPSFVVHGYELHDCSACGHRFLPSVSGEDHIAQVYGDDYFFGGGAGYPDYTALGAAARAHGRFYGALLKTHLPSGRILDVGAAAGFVLQGLTENGFEGTGLEPNAAMATYGREKLGLEVTVGSLETVSDIAPVDAVTMIQVIGHFYDLKRAMEHVAALTRPGGFCLIEYWDRESLPARLMGKAWHEYSPPSVVHWFTADELSRLMGRNGFTPTDRGRAKKVVLGSHVRSLVEYKVKGWPVASAFTALTKLIPAQALLPYPALDLKWMLFQKTG